MEIRDKNSTALVQRSEISVGSHFMSFLVIL